MGVGEKWEGKREREREEGRGERNGRFSENWREQETRAEPP
jgi:hypothetical protein